MSNFFVNPIRWNNNPHKAKNFSEIVSGHCFLDYSCLLGWGKLTYWSFFKLEESDLSNKQCRRWLQSRSAYRSLPIPLPCDAAKPNFSVRQHKLLFKGKMGFVSFIFFSQYKISQSLLCKRFCSTSVQLNTSANNCNRNTVFKSSRNTTNSPALNTDLLSQISASSMTFSKNSHSWYLYSLSKFHLVGGTVDSFFCINSLRAYIVLEDLEKNVDKSLGFEKNVALLGYCRTKFMEWA